MRLAGDTARAADAAARNAQIICLSWAANYLVFGGRIDAADALVRRIAEEAVDAAQVEPQAFALVHQVRAARASAAGDLGRCLSGLESALQAFEQAGDLRNACRCGPTWATSTRSWATSSARRRRCGRRWARPIAWAFTT